jgi:hypothetical protein
MYTFHKQPDRFRCRLGSQFFQYIPFEDVNSFTLVSKEWLLSTHLGLHLVLFEKETGTREV